MKMRCLMVMWTGLWINVAAVASANNEWGHWRGPNANGSVENANPPVEWGEEKNVKWKVEVPGEGHATPVIWGDRIYVATAIKTDRQKEGAAESDQAAAQEQPTQQPPRQGRGGGRGGRRGGRGSAPPTNYYQFVLLAFDRNSGDEIWRTVAAEQVPHESKRDDNTFASASPITDGERVYVSFGSQGIFCFDKDGTQIWERNLGQMRTRNSFGEGATPALHGDTLVVPWDHEEQSSVAALDAVTGDVKWRVDRDERSTWATPLIVEHGAKTQVVLNGTRVRSYDLATGGLLWECGGQTDNPIPSPVLVDDTVVCMTGFRGNAVYAIPLSAQGDVTDTDAVRWSRNDTGPYVASPTLIGGQLYYSKGTSGTVTSVDARTGEVLIRAQRLEGIRGMYASPIAAADRVYFTGRDGTTTVIKHGKGLEVLAVNKLGEGIDASPAIVGDEIYLRSASHLYCIANSQ